MKLFALITFICSISVNSFAKIEIADNGENSPKNLAYIEDNSEWFALIRKDPSYELKKVRVKKSKGGEGIDVGVLNDLISSDPDALFLIRGIELKEGHVESQVRTNLPESLGIGKAIKLRFGNITGILEASGKVIKSEENKVIGFEKYTLEVKTAYGSGLILDKETQRQPMTSKIFWVGDLNRDGFPDIYLDKNRFENGEVSAKTLYLSEKIGKTYRLNLVATVPNE